jgi:hypothetical protein
MMAGSKIAKDTIKGLDVIGPIVGRQSDARQQDLDVGILQGGEDGIEIAARLVEGEPAQAIVPSELHDHDLGM